MFAKFRSIFTSLEAVRFGLLIMLVVIFPFNFTTNFIVLPLLSLFLLVVKNRTNLSLKILGMSSKGLWLTVIFFIHFVWFAPYMFTTWSAGYIEKTLPFILFPLMISSTPLDKEKVKIISRFFIWAVLTSYILSLMAAIYNYNYSVPRWGRPSDFFFHEQFTEGLIGIHPTYYSLMGVISSLFAFHFLGSRLRSFIIIIILTFFILLIDAKITVVVQVVLIIWLLVRNLAGGITLRKIGIAIVVLVLTWITINMTSSIYDYPHRRIAVNLRSSWERSYALDINDGDGGIVTRMAIWRSAFEVIRNNYVVGVGLGNEKEHLVREYEKTNIAFLINNKFNAHSQPLSYLISTGILGSLLLCSWWIPNFRDAIRIGSLTYFEFIGIILMVGLTESLFSRVLGVAIFAFFNALLVLKFVNNDK